jgi:hypothetical protein
MAARKTRKLTDAQARAIYRSAWSYTQLAAYYKVSQPTIADIKKHRSYRHIHQNTSPSAARPKPDLGAPAPSHTEVHAGGDVTQSGAVSHLSAAPDDGASLTYPAGKTGRPQPAGASLGGTCSACGSASETDLCGNCQAVATRVPGFGDGPLPHYGMDAQHLDFRKRNASRNKSLKSRQDKCAVREWV